MTNTRNQEINLVSHFPAEDPPSRWRYGVCCGIFRKQLAPDTVGNPSHFGMRGREGGGETGNQRWSRTVVLQRRGEGCWGGGGGRMEASLPGFHVEEIHLLELIKI